MKCPFCNAEIKDGSLYCEVCGEDIHIVPDFDPTIEDTCRETIESIAKDIFDEEPENKHIVAAGIVNNTSGTKGADDKLSARTAESDVDKSVRTTDGRTIKKRYEEKKRANKISLSICLIIVFLALCVVVPIVIIKLNSFEFKLSRADKYYEELYFDKAIVAYEELIEKNRYDISVQEKYALALYGAGRYDEYESVLLGIVDSTDADESQIMSAYGKLVALYVNQNEYNKIKQLVLASGSDVIINGYSDYLVDSPVILTEEGKYDLPQLLNISSEKGYEIIFTVVQSLDGKETVLEDESVYTGPYYLDDGIYNVSAYCVNENDVTSDVVTAKIEIKLLPPKEPEIFPLTGAYFSPRYIEVVGFDGTAVSVYYTDDGSVPGTMSYLYTGPIIMLPGISHYRFIAIDDKGLCSKPVEVNYELDIPCEVSVTDAKNKVFDYLHTKGTIIDATGTLPDGGQLGVDLKNIQEVNGSYAYIFEEFVYDGGEKAFLGVFYYVDLVTGAVSKLE